MTRSHLERSVPTDEDAGGSTRQVALASLPARLLPASPHAPRAVSDYREFQDGEVVPGTRYKVCRLIGTGGMGRVYEVEHVELGKRFVLKSLLRELSRRDDLVARLRNEWRALARLEHANIVNVTDAGTSTNGVPFYVMERLEGETLGALMHRQRRLQPQRALGLAAAVLDGLHAAHQIGVVHRDVKPPNVFLTANAVKILDFGIAKIRDANDVITARGIAVGTPRYMSPEQAQGVAVDARSDIYATGLMLFEMLSGVGPFDDAKDHNELLLAQLGRKAPLLSSICVVSPELDAVVAGLLAKDPRERPASAHDVAQTLRSLNQRYAHLVGTQAPTVNPATLPEPPTRIEGRRPTGPVLETRPDAPAAFERAQSRDSADTTTLQPAIEVATTIAHALPGPGHTQRLPNAAPDSAPSFHGPDTIVERPTQAPTAVPASAPVRTEMLHVVEVAPGAPLGIDPGPTRTSVPAADSPNLTPPPVVPAAVAGAGRSDSGRGQLRPWSIGAAVLVLLAAGAWALRHGEPARHAQGASLAAAAPRPPALPAAAVPAASVAPHAPSVLLDSATGAAPSASSSPRDVVAAPRTPVPALGSKKTKGIFLVPGPAPKRSQASQGGGPPKTAGSMPGSGL